MRRPIMLSGLALACLVLLLVAVIFAANEDSVLGKQSGRQLDVPTVSQANLTPIPAQSPAPDPFATLTAQRRPQITLQGGSAVGTPVTEASIRDYIARNQSVGGIVAKNVSIESVQFITIEQLKALLNNDPYLDQFPLDEPVVYVTLSGDFPVLDADALTGAVMHGSYRVFSARTGNELMGGLK